MASDRRGKRKPPKEPLLEWIAAAVGLILALGMMAIIGLEALRGDSVQPPAIEVRATRIMAVPSGFVVEVLAINHGGGAAAVVQVEGELKAGDVGIETSSLTLDYVPGFAEREGGLFFTRDPRRHRLELRALGYQAP